MTDEKKTSESQARALYAQAEKALKEAHKDEFEKILTGLYEAAGLTRRVRKTKEEREAERLAAKEAREAAKREKERQGAIAMAKALAAEYPDLIQVQEPVEVPGGEPAF